jgi:hypothetical protein
VAQSAWFRIPDDHFSSNRIAMERRIAIDLDETLGAHRIAENTAVGFHIACNR